MLALSAVSRLMLMSNSWPTSHVQACVLLLSQWPVRRSMAPNRTNGWPAISKLCRLKDAFHPRRGGGRHGEITTGILLKCCICLVIVTLEIGHILSEMLKLSLCGWFFMGFCRVCGSFTWWPLPFVLCKYGLLFQCCFGPLSVYFLACVIVMFFFTT